MGVIRFQVHPPRRVTSEMTQRAYFSAPDRSVWQSRAWTTDDGLVIERDVSDSGNFHIPWQVQGQGELTLSTAWLMEREQPYQLEIELARGKLNQVRNQLSDWQSIGLEAPPDLISQIQKAVAMLAAASNIRDRPSAAEKANEVIRAGVEVAQRLACCYAEQAIASRTLQNRKLPTQLGVHLGDSPLSEGMAPLIKGSFNTGCIPLNWRRVEQDEDHYNWSVSDQQLTWCQEKGLRIHAGPLLSFDDIGVPDWLCAWGGGDFDSLLPCVSQFVEAAVLRYRGKVQLWRCAARINVGDVLDLSQEDRLRLAVYAVEVTRRLDPHTPVIVSFDQPWGEYTSRQSVDFPCYLADTLVRANVGLSGLGLEINMGYHPGGSDPRDLLDLSQLLDFWSMLGLPLHLMLTVPSSNAADPQAKSSSRPLTTAYSDGWSPRIQKQWAELFLPLLLSKACVHSVVWNQLRDVEPHIFPHGGLFDADGHPKPALGVFATMREKYLE